MVLARTSSRRGVVRLAGPSHGRTAPTRTRGWAIRRIALVVGPLLLMVAGWETWRSLPRGTDISPHEWVPIEAGKNAVWCAVSQLAWQRTEEVVGTRTLEIDGAGDADGLEVMNRGPFPADALDRASYVIGAGGAGTDVAFRAALVKAFGSVPDGVVVPPVEGNHVAVFAYLRKALPFAVRFDACKTPIAFRTGPMPFVGRKSVSAFGFDEPREPARATEAPRADDALTQVRLHWQDDETSPSEFILELRTAARERIFLARVPPEPTLAETWTSVSRLLSGEGRPLPAFDRLAIPRIDAGRLFASFDGLLGEIVGSTPSGARLDAFSTSLRFRLDETGARLDAAAYDGVLLGGPSSGGRRPSYVFDRPFLLALMERQATRPYLLLWVGNPDLLVAAE